MKLKPGRVYRVVRASAMSRGWEKGTGEKWAWVRRLTGGEAQWFYESELREVSAVDALAEIARSGP